MALPPLGDGDGELVGSGTFETDRSAALGKLAGYQFPERLDAVRLWVRAAVAGAASRILLEEDEDGFELRLAGLGLERRWLEDPFLAALSEPGGSAARFVSLGLIRALRDGPRSVRLSSGSGASRASVLVRGLDDWELGPAPEEGNDTVVRVEFGWAGWLRRLFGRARDAEEDRERCLLCPIPILVSGSDLLSGLPKRWPAEDSRPEELGVRRWYDPVSQCDEPSWAAPDIVIAPAEHAPALRMRVQIPGLEEALRLGSWEQGKDFRRVSIQVYAHGVHVCRLEGGELGLPFPAWINDDRLTLDASMSGVRKDGAFERALGELRAVQRRALEALIAEFEAGVRSPEREKAVALQAAWPRSEPFVPWAGLCRQQDYARGLLLSVVAARLLSRAGPDGRDALLSRLWTLDLRPIWDGPRRRMPFGTVRELAASDEEPSLYLCPDATVLWRRLFAGRPATARRGAGLARPATQPPRPAGLEESAAAALDLKAQRVAAMNLDVAPSELEGAELIVRNGWTLDAVRRHESEAAQLILQGRPLDAAIRIALIAEATRKLRERGPPNPAHAAALDAALPRLRAASGALLAPAFRGALEDQALALGSVLRGGVEGLRAWRACVRIAIANARVEDEWTLARLEIQAFQSALRELVGVFDWLGLLGSRDAQEGLGEAWPLLERLLDPASGAFPARPACLSAMPARIQHLLSFISVKLLQAGEAA